MKSLTRPAAMLLSSLAMALFALPAMAQPMTVNVWTDRGDEAVYQPGDPLQVGVQTNVGAHLLVYEIDAEGRINVIFPIAGFDDFVEGGQTYDIPNHQSDLELVVQGPVGQGYIVAIVSRQPFEALPWYLRPYDAQAEALGYFGAADEEEGITAEGRIVGDPFVAMEKIRRRVVTDDQNPDAFYSAYTSYYVHEVVKYPRYVCNDCHRPGHYEWFAGYDPYYATCSAFTFRINYGWYWGPGYWFGHVPRYIYSCNPGYGWGGRYWFSGWNGWGYWCSTWGGPLRAKHYKAPANYIPPHRYKDSGTRPPGFITYNKLKKGQGVGLGRNRRSRGTGENGRTVSDATRRVQRQPAGRSKETDRGGNARTVGGARESGKVDRGATRQPAREIRPNGEGGSIRMIKPDRTATRKPAYRPRTTDRGVGALRSPARSVQPGVNRAVKGRSTGRIAPTTKRLTPRSTAPARVSTRGKATGVSRSTAPAARGKSTTVKRGASPDKSRKAVSSRSSKSSKSKVSRSSAGKSSRGKAASSKTRGSSGGSRGGRR